MDFLVHQINHKIGYHGDMWLSLVFIFIKMKVCVWCNRMVPRKPRVFWNFYDFVTKTGELVYIDNRYGITRELIQYPFTWENIAFTFEICIDFTARYKINADS